MEAAFQKELDLLVNHITNMRLRTATPESQEETTKLLDALYYVSNAAFDHQLKTLLREWEAEDEVWYRECYPDEAARNDLAIATDDSDLYE
jgi:hypothetical protein